jgi:hypothetical protein
MPAKKQRPPAYGFVVASAAVTEEGRLDMKVALRELESAIGYYAYDLKRGREMTAEEALCHELGRLHTAMWLNRAERHPNWPAYLNGLARESMYGKKHGS